MGEVFVAARPVSMPASVSIWLLAGVITLFGCSRAPDVPRQNPAEVGKPPAANRSVEPDEVPTLDEVMSAQPGPDAIHATVLSPRNLTPAELRYGRAPQPHPSITYKPEVVLVAGGADSIRGVSPDGLVWTIDARANGADGLSVGRVAFVTGRCVGRVLHLTRRGNNLEVLLGPVELTDIYRRLELAITQPLDLQQSIELPMPQFDGVSFPLEGDKIRQPPSGVDMRPLLGSTTASPAMLEYGGHLLKTQVSPGIPQRINVGFQTSPLITGKGFGAELRHQGKGVVIVAQAQLQIATPELDLYIKVIDDHVSARLILKNTAGLLLAFDAVTGDDFSRNVHWHMPFQGVSFPLGGPAPFTIDFRHSVDVETVFSGKNSQFSARGEYGLKGDIGLVYSGKQLMTVGPHGFSTLSSLFKNMSGTSFGPRGIIISHHLNIVAGMGYLGFSAGPSAKILTSLGTARGSDGGIVRCAGATLAMQMTGGVGWTIPAGLAEAVNAVLSLFRVDPIPDHGGVYLPWQHLFPPKTAGAEAGICGGGEGT